MMTNASMTTSSVPALNTSFHDYEDMTAFNGSQSSATTITFNSTDYADVSLNRTEHGLYSSPGTSSELHLSKGEIVAIVIGSVAVIFVLIAVIIVFVRWRHHKKKSKAWVDNLTLSYIADSNIDLTKDNYDEMVSLDNDNFLNSLTDSNAFSVWTPDTNAKQYTYSYF